MGIDAYRIQAGLYDRLLEPVNVPLRKLSRRLLPPVAGQVVVDLGCGTGAALADYRAHGCVVMGADPSGAMLARARERLGDDADLRLIDGPGVPFDDDCADLVVVSLVLHSIARDEAVGLLGEARRLLAGEGRVLVTDFGAGGLRFPRGHLTRGLTAVAEVAAGPRHAGNAVRYLRTGGLEPLAGEAGLGVERSRLVAGGNIVIAVLVDAG